jgi:hypothetical protein
VKPTSWIIIILILFGHATKSSAQLWRYLDYDPKAEKAFEKTLDKEACSIIVRSEIVYGQKSTYKSRTYCIQSFDGNRSKIVLSERSHGHMLSIQGPRDSMKIEDFTGLVKMHFLRPELLEVVYSPRGGSDQGFDYVMILGINEKRLCIVTEFLTVDESNMADEYHLYEVHLKLQGSTLRNCELALTIRNLLKSGASRSKSYDRKSVYVLRFETSRNIFYNKIKHLNAVYEMYPSGGKGRLLTGDYPMVDLGADEEYYYIDDTWYALVKEEAGKNSILSKVH